MTAATTPVSDLLESVVPLRANLCPDRTIVYRPADLPRAATRIVLEHFFGARNLEAVKKAFPSLYIDDEKYADERDYMLVTDPSPACRLRGFWGAIGLGTTLAMYLPNGGCALILDVPQSAQRVVRPSKYRRDPKGAREVLRGSLESAANNVGSALAVNRVHAGAYLLHEPHRLTAAA